MTARREGESFEAYRDRRRVEASITALRLAPKPSEDAPAPQAPGLINLAEAMRPLRTQIGAAVAYAFSRPDAHVSGMVRTSKGWAFVR